MDGGQTNDACHIVKTELLQFRFSLAVEKRARDNMYNMYKH